MVAARLLVTLVFGLGAMCGSLTAQDDSGPPVPFEDVDACPFEGCVYREWNATAPVNVRVERRGNAAILFRAAAGEKVTALTGVVITTRAGHARLRWPTDLETSEGTIRLNAGEVLYLLTYQGEGYTKAWLRGRLLEWADISEFIGNLRCEPPATNCPVDPVVQPENEWWIQIRNSDGQVGWTDEPDKFDGKDAFG
jgi:hypothetical protein